MANLTLEQFRRAYLAVLAAWNRQDLATAFAALSPDCEWHSELSQVAGEPGVWVGREEITRFHEEWFELIPDWRVEERQYISWEEGLRVAGLDPSIAADARRSG